MLCYANLDMENAYYVYPTSPGPPPNSPNSPVCILLFYMTGRRLSKCVLAYFFQVHANPIKTVLSPIKEDPAERCKMNSIGRTNR